jgi:hypothetical protein
VAWAFVGAGITSNRCINEVCPWNHKNCNKLIFIWIWSFKTFLLKFNYFIK